jgi:release factor glutamine methyltransferase
VATTASPSTTSWEQIGWRELAVEVGATGNSSAAERCGGQQQQQQPSSSTTTVRLRLPLPTLRKAWQRRLEERAPYQYLLSTAHWRDLILSVGPGVLVPRPETEMMVDLAEAALDKQQQRWAAAEGAAPPTTPTTRHPALRPWADLGTGSGAIAIALARMLLKRRQRVEAEQAEAQASPAVVVFAVDKSPQAAAYARHNAQVECGLDLAQEVVVLEGSWAEPVKRCVAPRSLGGVLSNPPYIPRREMVGRGEGGGDGGDNANGGLQAEVARHEPWTALDGGEGDGIDSLLEVIEGAAELLAPGGFLALETAGGEQARLLAGLLRRERGEWGDVELVDDCYGREGRFVTAWRT